jgi:hypothetical protein
MSGHVAAIEPLAPLGPGSVSRGLFAWSGLRCGGAVDEQLEQAGDAVHEHGVLARDGV